MTSLSKTSLPQASDLASSAEAAQRGFDQQISVLAGLVGTAVVALKRTVATAWTNYLVYRSKRRAYDELMALDQRMLSDIGIGRHEVQAVVYGEGLDGTLRAPKKAAWTASREAHA
jgi:uncharacterized protein YjiS (DUF1127 family)